MVDPATSRCCPRPLLARRLYGMAGLALCAGMLGCSGGRYYSQDGGTVDAGMARQAGSAAADAAAVCEPQAADRENTLFVHPGLFFSSVRLDEGLAMAGGHLLVQRGYGARVLDVSDRRPEKMAAAMTDDPGSRFIGLHYSLGGRMGLVARSVDAARTSRISRC